MAIFEKKTTCILIISLGFFTTLKAQKTDFEGQLTYSLNLVSKNKDISNKQLATFFGDTVIAYIKKGNYRQRNLNAYGVTDVIYLAADNNWYFKMYGIDTLFYLDCSQEEAKLLDTHKSDSTTTILGYNCKQLAITTSSSKNTFYYADSLYINPSYFSRHQLYFYNLYAKQTESIYLKVTNENELFVSSMTALNVTKKEIDDDIFALPKLPKWKK